MILLVCKATIMVNLTTFTWNDFDNNIKDRATKTCMNNYDLCLTKFVKTDKIDYRAYCGGNYNDIPNTKKP